MDIKTNLNEYGSLKNYTLIFETKYGKTKYKLSISEFESLDFHKSENEIIRQIQDIKKK